MTFSIVYPEVHTPGASFSISNTKSGMELTPILGRQKQKVAFSGSVLDDADAKWYEDDVVMDVSHSSAALDRYPPSLNEQASSSSVGPSLPEASASRERRPLTRYRSMQAVDRFLNAIDDSD